jgi:hypothetical protein
MSAVKAFAAPRATTEAELASQRSRSPLHAIRVVTPRTNGNQQNVPITIATTARPSSGSVPEAMTAPMRTTRLPTSTNSTSRKDRRWWVREEDPARHELAGEAGEGQHHQYGDPGGSYERPA